MINPFARTPAFEAFCAAASPRIAVWRIAAGFVLTVALIIAAIAGISGALFLLGPSDFDLFAALSTPEGVLAMLATFIPWWIALAITLWAFHRRSLRSLFGRGPGLGLFLKGAGYALAVSLVGVVIGSVFVEAPVWRAPSVGLWLSGAVAALPLILIQTGAEELVFRGYLQQQLGARFRSPLIWAVLPALLFGAMHWNPLAPGGPWPIIVITATVGLILAAVVARTGGLAAAWGIHFAVNTSALLLVGAPDYLSGLALAAWRKSGEDILVWLDLAFILGAAVLAWVWVSRSPRGG